MAIGGAASLAASPDASSRPAGQACTRFATPSGSDGNPGSRRSPFATASKLIATLRPGQTGCLSGHFREYLKFQQAGRAGAPITLRAAPGQSATICGHMWFTAPASHWRLTRLGIDGSCSTQDTIVIHGNQVQLDHDDITNGYRGLSCLSIGTHSYAEVVVYDTVLSHDRIHDCGIDLKGHTHGVYASATRNMQIVDNYIYDNAGYSVQLYPDAQHTLIARNIVDGSRSKSGVVLAGEKPYASSYNLVTHNMIIRNPDYGVYRSWPGPVGTGNLIQDNCFWKNALGDFPPNPTGLTQGGNVRANPGFVGETPAHYRLRRGSSCRAMHPRGHVGI